MFIKLDPYTMASVNAAYQLGMLVASSGIAQCPEKLFLKLKYFKCSCRADIDVGLLRHEVRLL